MQLHVKGKNLEITDSLRDYAERKLARLDRQLHEEARVEIELAVERNPSIAANQVAEATVSLKGRTLRAREVSNDMKAAIDALSDKLLRRVKEEHDRRSRRQLRGPDKRDGSAAQAEAE